MPTANVAKDLLARFDTLLFANPSKAWEIMERSAGKHADKEKSPPHVRNMLFSAQDRAKLKENMARHRIAQNIDDIRKRIVEFKGLVSRFIDDLDKETKKKSDKWTKSRTELQEEYRTKASYVQDVLERTIGTIDAEVEEGRNLTNDAANAVLDAAEAMNMQVSLRKWLSSQREQEALVKREFVQKEREEQQKEDRRDLMDRLADLKNKSERTMSSVVFSIGKSKRYALDYFPILVTSVAKPQELMPAAKKAKTLESLRSRTLERVLSYPERHYFLLLEQPVLFLWKGLSGKGEEKENLEDAAAEIADDLGFSERKHDLLPQRFDGRPGESVDDQERSLPLLDNQQRQEQTDRKDGGQNTPLGRYSAVDMQMYDPPGFPRELSFAAGALNSPDICWVCGTHKDEEKLDHHHVVPRSFGGRRRTNGRAVPAVP